MAFTITYRGGLLVLEGDLPPEQKTYLQEYLDKINRYKKIALVNGSPLFSLYQPPPATAAGIRSLKMRLKRRFEHLRVPATATLSVTKSCQCECAHCSAFYYNNSPKPMLSKAQWIEVIRQTVELGATSLILLGGEPLLRRDLSDLVDAVPRSEATVILFTNGEYLTSQKCRELQEAGLLGAFVSLDSADPHIHDTLRLRKGLFEKTLEGIENLMETGLVAGISSYLSSVRLKEGVFGEMMELGRRVGAHEVTFFDAIPTGRWLKDESCLLTEGDRSKIDRLVRDYRSRNAYPGLSVQSTLTSRCGSAFCFAANTQFYMTPHGEMCPCDFTPLTIGKFPDHSIRELWEKMIQTPPYDRRAPSCRMQDPEFRRKYISPLPEEGPFPYPHSPSFPT